MSPDRTVLVLAALMALLSSARCPGADVGEPCKAGISAADAALAAATAERVVRHPARPVPLHLLTRSTPSGCARVRFSIDAAGTAQEPVLERFHPDPRFGRAILDVVRAMEFRPAPGPGARDDALIVVSFSAGELFDKEDGAE